MAKIALRAYLRDIENLIASEQAVEAMANCQAILEVYPRHLGAARLLGNAGLLAEDYKPAKAAYLQVLASLPDDLISHIGLSVLLEISDELEPAVWHMQRAAEIQPGNQTLQKDLQRLMRRRAGEEPTEYRLTRYALAGTLQLPGPGSDGTRAAGGDELDTHLVQGRLTAERRPDRRALRGPVPGRDACSPGRLNPLELKPRLYETRAGGRIYPIPLEAFPGLWGWAYLVFVDDGYRVLIDTGSGTEQAQEHLMCGLRIAVELSGIPSDSATGIPDLTHIFITHGHIDHFGGLAGLKAHTQVRTGVHELAAAFPLEGVPVGAAG